MNSITSRLKQLRTLFIIYFIVLLAVDFGLGWGLMRGDWPSFGYGLGHLSRGSMLTLILFFSGILFVVGLWLFQNLRQLKNWARVTLLVVGWLNVIDVVSSLLFASGQGFLPWLERLVPGLDWQRVLLVDRVKDLLGLLFWGYLIYVLQLTPEVKREFLEPPGSSGPEPGDQQS